MQTGFPERSTKIGTTINNFLQNKEELSSCHNNDEVIHLLFSANRWECIGKIREALENGRHVVCDRYWYSGVAYSSAKGLDYEWCKGMDRGLERPDLIVYLKGDPEVLAKREGYGGERFERVEFQRKVGEFFDRMFAEDKEIVGRVRVETV